MNAAAADPRPPLGEQTLEQWGEVIAVNLTAPFGARPALRARDGPAGWGRIINVASQQALRAFGNSGGYGASEGWADWADPVAVRGLGRPVACAATRSRPGSWPPRSPRPWRATRCAPAAPAARTMIGRNGEPADFEGVTVFLASRASDYVTGQLIFVDGGFSVT